MEPNALMIQKIRSFFKDKPVKKVYVFGSFARGEARTNSDLDLYLELDYQQNTGLAFYGWFEQLKELLNLDVDLVTTNSASPYIKPFIEKDKQLVYERLS
ncbi:nucleotidyltransferase family protein [Mucilaginibacter sp.]|uniref:nucleotidyltransferase family protein n=1 Tax=Mucilaginibacter sp. TaxID=1882438 RepID=UPI003B0079F1